MVVAIASPTGLVVKSIIPIAETPIILRATLSMIGVSAIGMMLFTSRPVGAAMATTIWGTSSSWTLTALPLFVWMGEILFRTKLSENLFKGLSPWMQKLPGGLIHVNVVGCALFAAISGSSAATVATVGKMSIPELRKRNYPEKILLGSLAGSGTLGLLIPPSVSYTHLTLPTILRV